MPTARPACRTRAKKHLLRAGTVLVLTAGMMPYVGGASYARWVPETLSSVVNMSRHAGEGILGPLLAQRDLPFAATELAVIWAGSGGPPRIRTSSDRGTWSAWRQITESEDMFDPSTQTHYSELIAGAGARAVQISAARGLVRDSLSVAVINTRDGPLRRVLVERTAIAATAEPGVISRRAWGADESIRKGQPAFAPVNKIFLHHTVTPNNADPAATIRSIYAYHVQVRGWEDIGYNYLVDSRGNIYQGRYSGPPGQSPPGEDSGGRGVVGAHTEQHNVGSTGIALLGNTESLAPSQSAVDSLVKLVAWKADRHNINPTGVSGSFPNVAGHRDSPSGSTECPGAKLYSMLPSIRQRAKQIMDSSRSAGDGPLSGPIGPILNGPSPGLGDSVSGLLKSLGL